MFEEKRSSFKPNDASTTAASTMRNNLNESACPSSFIAVSNHTIGDAGLLSSPRLP